MTEVELYEISAVVCLLLHLLDECRQVAYGHDHVVAAYRSSDNLQKSLLEYILIKALLHCIR